MRGEHFCEGTVEFSKTGETALEAADRVQREVKAYKDARPDHVKKRYASERRKKLSGVKGYVFKKFTHMMPVGTEVCTYTGAKINPNATPAYPTETVGRVVWVDFGDAHAPQMYVFWYDAKSVGKTRADFLMVTSLGENPSCKIPASYRRLKRDRRGWII